jgi:hypothetical protein
MRTPTLIVRLAGLYLLVNALFALFSLAQIPVPEAAGEATAGSGFPSINIVQNLVPAAGPVSDYLKTVKYIYAFGACMGLVVTRYAGWFARILTFDAADNPADRADLAYQADDRFLKP